MPCALPLENLLIPDFDIIISTCSSPLVAVKFAETQIDSLKFGWMNIKGFITEKLDISNETMVMFRNR